MLKSHHSEFAGSEFLEEEDVCTAVPRCLHQYLARSSWVSTCYMTGLKNSNPCAAGRQPSPPPFGVEQGSALSTPTGLLGSPPRAACPSASSCCVALTEPQKNLTGLHTFPIHGQDMRLPLYGHTPQAQHCPLWLELTLQGTPRPGQETTHQRSSSNTNHLVSQHQLMLRRLNMFLEVTGPVREGAGLEPGSSDVKACHLGPTPIL